MALSEEDIANDLKDIIQQKSLTEAFQQIQKELKELPKLEGMINHIEKIPIQINTFYKAFFDELKKDVNEKLQKNNNITDINKYVVKRIEEILLGSDDANKVDVANKVNEDLTKLEGSIKVQKDIVEVNNFIQTYAQSVNSSLSKKLEESRKAMLNEVENTCTKMLSSRNNQLTKLPYDNKRTTLTTQISTLNGVRNSLQGYRDNGDLMRVENLPTQLINIDTLRIQDQKAKNAFRDQINTLLELDPNLTEGDSKMQDALKKYLSDSPIGIMMKNTDAKAKEMLLTTIENAVNKLPAEQQVERICNDKNKSNIDKAQEIASLIASLYVKNNANKRERFEKFIRNELEGKQVHGRAKYHHGLKMC